MWKWLLMGAPAAGKLPRDARVDALRGLALIAIFINHVPANPLSHGTFSAFGFSDAAEIFVFLAGYATALAFAGQRASHGYAAAGLKLVARAGTLYITHLMVFILVAAMVGMAFTRAESMLYFEIVNLTPFFNAPHQALAGAVTLTYQPFFMDILPLYIVLLLAFPLVAWLAWRSPLLLLLASATLYALAVSQGWNLPNGPGRGVWFFNPFAWQALFVLGALVAVAATADIRLPRSPVLIGLAAGYLAFCFLAASPWSPIEAGRISDLIGFDFALDISKTDLSLWRLANVLAFLYLAAQLVRVDASWLESAPVQTLATLGRHSLPVFAVGIVLSVGGHLVILERGQDALTYAGVNAVGIAILLFTGMLVEWYRRLTDRKARPAQPREPRVQNA